MRAIIHHGEAFGTLNDVIRTTSEITQVVIRCLKAGTAKKLVDNDYTLMYELPDDADILPQKQSITSKNKKS